jgi:hypothetical protein
LNATLGGAGIPIEYIIRTDVEGSDGELFWEDDKRRRYQMPLEGQNFKHDNKLIYKLLKAACDNTNAWAWIQNNYPSADGRKAWFALIAHYDGYGKLNKRVQRAILELLKLHYKTRRSFPLKSTSQNSRNNSENWRKTDMQVIRDRDRWKPCSAA